MGGYKRSDHAGRAHANDSERAQHRTAAESVQFGFGVSEEGAQSTHTLSKGSVHCDDVTAIALGHYVGVHDALLSYHDREVSGRDSGRSNVVRHVSVVVQVDEKFVTSAWRRFV